MHVFKNPRFLLVEVVSPHIHGDEAIKNLDEVRSLVDTFGGIAVARQVQHRAKPNQATYVGSGKVEELKQIIASYKIDIVVLNSIVNSGQIFRLEKKLLPVNPQIAVWDRIDLILHIFDKHACSAEAKLQIELARLLHLGPRIYNTGVSLSQQAGGIGTRGIGEKSLELSKRYIKTRIGKIQDKLKKIALHREKHIDKRKTIGLFTASLVGYTNAGKTSLFNLLTGKEKLVKNSLFTTLDSSVGKINYNGIKKPVLLSDTVGFIDRLPPFLIDAFRSTLMESVNADIILHVIDSSDIRIDKKITITDEILEDLEIDREKNIYVFNKADKISFARLKYIYSKYHGLPHVFVSAKTKEGIEELPEIISKSITPSILFPKKSYLSKTDIL